MKFLSWRTLLVAALFSCTVMIPFEPWEGDAMSQFALEATMTSDTGGVVELYYSTGQGFSHAASVRVPLIGDSVPRVYRLRLPAGRYQQFRFDPNDKASVVTIAKIRVVDGNHNVLRAIGPEEFTALHQISQLQVTADQVTVNVAARADDPQLLLNFSPLLELHFSIWDVVKTMGRTLLPPIGIVFAAILGLLALGELASPVRNMLARIGAWARRHPAGALAALALAAVSASDYPVIFLGKSYVSPNLGSLLLYESFPTVPGTTSNRITPLNGADIGAAMWQHLPMSTVQHRALVRDHELPLWNRYNSAGTPLLGQGQSMFGDPLHFILIIGKGAAWAWDLKYVMAKWIFAAALGLTVLTITRHLPAAAVVSLAAPFMGFFVYRFNHPAFVSFCYAPFVLYCWARLAEATQLWPAARSVALLVLANIALMNSGTVKEAYVLLLCMNFSGVCLLLGRAVSWRAALGKLALASWGGVIFILLTTPVWLTFLDSLRVAYTSYNNPNAFQIQPSLLIGAFDEIFYRGLTDARYVFDPSANFLVLGGVLYFLATLRQASRTMVALGISALLPLSIAFGLIPPGLVAGIPFIGNVVHVDNSFSCALIVLLGVLAGAGFSQMAERLGTEAGKFDLRAAGTLLFALVFAFVAFRQAVHRQALGNTFSPIQSGRELPVDDFTWVYLSAILLALIVLAIVVRRSLQSGRLTAPAGLLITLCVLVLLWRFGLHAERIGPSFGAYLVKPSERADLHAPSPAVGFIQKAQSPEPFRTFGMDDNFTPGWSATYGLESPSGADGLLNPFYRDLTTLPATGLELVWGWRLYLRSEKVAQSQRFLDFLNVRYYLGSSRGAVPLSNSLQLAQHADLNVYESTSAWPRAFFTDRLSRYEGPAELLQGILTSGDRPFAASLGTDPTAKEAQAALSPDLEGRVVIAAHDYHLSSNHTSFAIEVDRPGVIVLGEAYWPGDSIAKLNGKPVPVMRVNHAFQGFFVQAAGKYHVRVEYWPKHFSTSLRLCALGAILLLLSLSFAWKIDRSRLLSQAGNIPNHA